MECKHEIKNRRAIGANTNRYGRTQIVIVCLSCGLPLFSSVVADEKRGIEEYNDLRIAGKEG